MRALSAVLLLITSSVFAQQNTQRSSIETTKRSIRQDVPMTNAIRKAFAAGTRDFSGKPGPNYWQFEADYTIQASIDPATQVITGTE
ncbi:MAG TPA: M1 family peptidase, partial [Emticicia sp.]